MIDQWFKHDLGQFFDTHSTVVFIDQSGDGKFLLKTLREGYQVHVTSTDIEELKVKYQIEKDTDPKTKHVIYTQRPKGQLKFIREYCETNGCLEIRYLQHYVKDKVHKTLNLNINLPHEELIAAAKVSVGKDRTYWMDLSHKGAAEIFDLEKELLPFLHDPEKFDTEKYDPQIRETFYKRISKLLGAAYSKKPAATLADEVVKSMLDGLALGHCKKELYTVYKDWLDSRTYRESFDNYLEHYTLPSNASPATADVAHPFTKLDEIWLKELISKLSDQAFLKQAIVKIKKRQANKQARSLEIRFWEDVISIVEFDPQNIGYLNSLAECAEFYKQHFCKLDTAIRNLYLTFLNKDALLQPLQDLYREHVAVMLNKWFQFWNEYQENQTGTLQKIINESSTKTAIIVGDGVAYEMAEQVAAKVPKKFSISKESIWADIPSETENNMSRIYIDNGQLEAVHKNREKYLSEQNPNTPIDFIRLDEVNDDALPGKILICTYKDIDDMGEKLQQKALKYFPETINFFAKKISQLLNNGYAKVCLITDHGFVLTGLLNESDKVSLTIKGEHHKAERYIRTEDSQPHLGAETIEVHRSYKAFDHLYFSKGLNPFKTPGVYGFAHGGLAPQEVVTPFFTWEHASDGVETLSVAIENKEDLQGITGELFPVKLKADSGDDGLFSSTRKLCLLFFVNNSQVAKSDIFSIKNGEAISKEFEYDGNSTINIQLVDAETKQLLDSAVTTRNNDRDLGGLL
jgi:hypothetical protein